MAKSKGYPHSQYSRDATLLLGQLIRRGRIQRRLTAGELAERIGTSRGLIQRIERGDPGCAIGSVFEAAAVVGVPLFDPDPAMLSRAIDINATTLTLLPKSVRPSRIEVKDDF